MNYCAEYIRYTGEYIEYYFNTEAELNAFANKHHCRKYHRIPAYQDEPEMWEEI